MRAISINGKSIEEISSALQQSVADGFRPTLAIVFISIKQDRKTICDMLHKQGIDVLGATTAGEFIDGHQSEGAAAILLLDLNPDYYTLLFEDIGDRTMEEIASIITQKALRKFAKPAFILCSTGVSSKGELFEGDVLIRNMARALGPYANIYGGMAGDDITFSGSYVFTWQKETDFGVVTLVLNENKISLKGMAISGWKPLGISRTVTRSEDGWIYTIDDKPALEMYLKYLGMNVNPGDDKYKMFEDVGIHYPFQVEGIGDPIMRTPFLINGDTDAIKLDYPIPEGTKFRFSVPPDFDIVENVLEKANELKDESLWEAEALLIFSCAGRLSALGPMTNLENEGLFKIWKAPMAGFFTYGEYGMSSNGIQEFHSTTCCWVVLKEK